MDKQLENIRLFFEEEATKYREAVKVITDARDLLYAGKATEAREVLEDFIVKFIADSMEIDKERTMEILKGFSVEGASPSTEFK